MFGGVIHAASLGDTIVYIQGAVIILSKSSLTEGGHSGHTLRNKLEVNWLGHVDVEKHVGERETLHPTVFVDAQTTTGRALRARYGFPLMSGGAASWIS